MNDLFGDVPQPQSSAAGEARKPLSADDVRFLMLELIAAVSGADVIPFPLPEFEKKVAMFPIMAQWLPEDEGKQLCFEFDREVERLRKAA